MKMVYNIIEVLLGNNLQKFRRMPSIFPTKHHQQGAASGQKTLSATDSFHVMAPFNVLRNPSSSCIASLKMDFKKMFS